MPPPRRTLFPGLQDLSGPRRALIEELVQARRDSDLSQTEIAARMGTSQSAVARLESGDARRAAVDAGALRGGAGPHRQLAGPTRRRSRHEPDRHPGHPLAARPPAPPEPQPPALAVAARGATPPRPSASAAVVIGAPDWLAQRLLDQRVVTLSGEVDDEAANRAVAQLGLLDATGDDPSACACRA